MVNLWRFDPAKNLKIQEPDDYLERKDNHSPAPEPQHKSASLLRPLVIGIMVACISQSIAELIRHQAPDWKNYLFFVAPIIASLAGYASYQAIQKRYLSSQESMRYQIFELVVIFLMCKFSTLLDSTFSEVIDAAKGWFAAPRTFFDGETLLIYALSLLGWFSASQTAKDLHHITDPTLYIGEKSPIHRMSNRFYGGGAILLISTAFARVRFMDILQDQNPRVPGLILNVLIYFMLGLFIIGQLNYVHHKGIWRRQRVLFDPDVRTKWLRYSAIFLVIVTFMTYLLPTGYTVGLLDIVRYIINVLLFIINILFFIISYPVLLLLSLLFKGAKAEVALPESPAVIEAPKPPPATPTSYWLELIKSLAFWIVAFIALGYVIHGYFRDRPHLLAPVKKFRPYKWMITLIKSLVEIFKRLRRSVTDAIPKFVNRLRSSASKKKIPFRAKRGQTNREKVFTHYLTTLNVAKEEGFTRAKTQTPSEFDQVLIPTLAGSSPYMSRLTATFIEARYSLHEIGKETVDQSEHDANTVQNTLKLQQNDSK